MMGLHGVMWDLSTNKGISCSCQATQLLKERAIPDGSDQPDSTVLLFQ